MIVVVLVGVAMVAVIVMAVVVVVKEMGVEGRHHLQGYLQSQRPGDTASGAQH